MFHFLKHPSVQKMLKNYPIVLDSRGEADIYLADGSGIVIEPIAYHAKQFEINTLAEEVVSDELEQAHFRADALGYLSYFGNVNFEADEGTAVVLNESLSGLNHSDFNWTYWFNR